MFLSAASVSCLTLSVLSILFKENWLFARRKFDSCNNIYGTIIGGMLLGSGMAIGGACPGMVLIQVGCGVPNSTITLIGACCGAFVYGLIEPSFRHLFTSLTSNTFPNVFLDKQLGINYSLLSFIIGSLLMSISMFIEYIVPWESELSSINSIKNAEHVSNCTNMHMLECRSWPPIIAGILVGLLQIPCVITLGNTIGGSSGYVVIMGQWLRFMPQSVKDSFPHFTGKLNYWWQVVYVTSAIFGSTLAVYFGNNGNVSSLLYESFDGIEGNSIEKAFIGGFIMVFGARLAKGCTSGHGLSGMGLLTMASMLAVAAMFIGGGITGLLLSALNL